MSNHVYQDPELTGSRPPASRMPSARTIAKAGETVRNMQWFEVVETRPSRTARSHTGR